MGSYWNKYVEVIWWTL